MKREQIVSEFSKRLTEIMQVKGYTSSRSRAGVRIDKLSDICGCSYQMARRYVLGEALPDIDVTLKIAQWLEVSPGWLLFGLESKVPQHIEDSKLIHIEQELLEYILLKSAQLFLVTSDFKELVSFILDIINDTTRIEADKTSILKIVDLSVNSAARFSGYQQDKKTSIA